MSDCYFILPGEAGPASSVHLQLPDGRVRVLAATEAAEAAAEREDHAVTLLWAATLRDAARDHLAALDSVICTFSAAQVAAEQALRAALGDPLTSMQRLVDERRALLRIARAAWEFSDTLRYSAPHDATDALDDLLMHAFAGDADEPWQAAGQAIRAALAGRHPEYDVPPRRTTYRRGDRATCRRCGQEIRTDGVCWQHIGPATPRHPAEPEGPEE